jgi:hypothetical protein
MSSSEPPRRRLAALLKVLAAFAVMAGAVSLATTAFEWGVLTGLAAGAGVIVVYAIPAAILGWPYIGLGDVLDFVVSVVDAIVSFFVGLFE